MDVCIWRRRRYRWWKWCRIGWKRSARSRCRLRAQWLSWVRSTLWFRGRGWLCRRISVAPNSSRIGRKLENTDLLVLHSSLPVEFVKLFITDLFITKMAEQTNFYAVQRSAPGSFKQLSDGVMNYTFTSTSTQTVGEGQGQILDVPYVKITLAMNSCSLPCKNSEH